MIYLHLFWWFILIITEVSIFDVHRKHQKETPRRKTRHPIIIKHIKRGVLNEKKAVFSIIRTALINNLDIQKYLIYVTENINKLEIDKLVPYYQLLPKGLKSS